MPKRNRDSESPSTGDRALDIKISRLKVRIEQGISHLKIALQLARGFERQKLGRRQKAANNEPKILLRLREEVIVLKQLDLGIVAKRQLLKRLDKVKRIAEDPAYGHVYGEKDLEGPKNEAEANVVGRLMNSNPVKECLPGIVGGVFVVLGIEDKSRFLQMKKIDDNMTAKNRTPGSSGARMNPLTRTKDDHWSGSESEVDVDLRMDETDQEDATDDSVPDHSAKINHNEDSASETEFLGFSDRIACSSEEEGFDETIPIQNDLPGSRTRLIPQTLKVCPSDSLSPAPSASAEPQQKKLHITPPPSTVILPSLMMGGYYSGSESASDIEDERSGAKKNRRGQRARQKIAEAKFGSAAKHLAKQTQNASRSAGWDPKRGATDGSSRLNAKGRMRIARPASMKGPTGANGDVLGARTKETANDGPIHPSWEAARKRKEHGKISINAAAGMGKKITFD